MEQATDNKYVLIIEDDEFLRSLAVTKLQKAGGIDVEVAADGQEGMMKLDERLPDLLLLDLMLPEIDGFGILKNLKETGRIDNTKVIVFSNLGSTDDIKRATSLGAHEYIVKSSFTLSELVEKVKAMVNA